MIIFGTPAIGMTAVGKMEDRRRLSSTDIPGANSQPDGFFRSTLPNVRYSATRVISAIPFNIHPFPRPNPAGGERSCLYLPPSGEVPPAASIIAVKMALIPRYPNSQSFFTFPEDAPTGFTGSEEIMQ